MPGKPEFDVVDTVSGEGGSYNRRIISHGGWRFVVVERNTLVSLQRIESYADHDTLADAVRRAGLMCLRVGCKTAKAMGISQWTSIEMINESHYKATLSIVTAVEAGPSVLVLFNGAYLRLAVRSQDGEPLRTGQNVRVVSLMSPGRAVVVPVPPMNAKESNS